MVLPNLMNDVPDGLIIPGFVSRRPEGVFIDLPHLYGAGGFLLFVDRLFTGEARFFRLDYAVFLKLLYDADWLAEIQGKCKEVKLAAGIVRFVPERRTLYRAVKILEGGKRVEYVFEPVGIEVSSDEPIYGEPDENGIASIVRYEHKTELQPAKLDFDEFVADMWLKGVKFGIDVKAVQPAIASATPARVTIARYLDPTEGSDAEIMEVSSHLHRDNSPRIMANGQADLRIFQNRFPQMAKGERMLKKIPRKLGKRGYRVTGEVIEPRMPKDLDLHALASFGTCVEQGPDGECIVAAQDGFLTLDTRSNKVSITEKIETKEGVSVRTTGDLALAVDEFIEHGEVQEGRAVKGKHMTFLSNVFGSVISQGGNIRISGNLSGGRAESAGGNVTLEARASRAVILAHDGEVTARFCENSTIIGKIVRVEYAVNCEIIGEEVFADKVEGCVVAAEKIKIISSDERKGRETLVTVLVPDFSGIDQRIVNLKKEIADARASIETKMREIERIKSDQECAKYFALAEKIRSGAIKLAGEQTGTWQKLVVKNAKVANQVIMLEEKIGELDKSIEVSEEELSCAIHDREGMGEDIFCVIDKVAGQTSGQAMKIENGMDIFGGMSGNDIRSYLQKADSCKSRFFSDDEGAINWKFKKPGES